MAKQPYIPLYIGDWEQDTNCITAMAEFALLKLTFKLFKAEKKGVFSTNLRSLSVLFKSNQQETKDILSELSENNILEIYINSESEIEIKSRRLMREATISETRSEIGRTGGRGHKSKSKANQKQTESKTKAKVKQNTDIDNDIVIDNEVKICTGEPDELLAIFQRWIKYKKDRKESYKTSDSLNTAFEKLKKFSKCDVDVARKIIDDAIGNNYAGFFEPKPVKPPSSQPQSKIGLAIDSSNSFMNRFNEQNNGNS